MARCAADCAADCAGRPWLAPEVLKRSAQLVDHIDQAAHDPLATEVSSLERLCSEATRLWRMLVQVEAMQSASTGAANVVTHLNAALLNVVRNSDTTAVQAALDAATLNRRPAG